MKKKVKQIMPIDDRVLSIIDSSKREIFRDNCIRNLAYTEKEPMDISLIPRVIEKQKEILIEDVSKRITHAALESVCDYLEGYEILNKTKFEDFLLNLPKPKSFFVGNGRYDFLEEDDNIKLIETNFVGVGTSGHPPKTTKTLLETFPKLNNHFYFKNPTDAMRSRMIENGVTNAILLTKNGDEDAYTDYLDRLIIQCSLKPVNVFIVPEKNYPDIKFFNGDFFYKNNKIDCFYPRNMEFEESMYNNKDFCFSLLNSNALFLDHFVTMLAENKDLRFLIKKDSSLKDYIARIFDKSELDDTQDFSDYVLKKKDVHSGKGVIIAPKNVSLDNAILQERIYTNQFPVDTIEGKKGNATYDTAVHFSYIFDLKSRNLTHFETSGYLTRFAFKDIVNLSQGGGIIPTLLEK
ncbi:MAG TPA: hypothetical protein P5277_04955 [Candidatus Paceibacterota bacterium]|nr:hypothetical protein [Candidatus Paceibacterota bacterium]